MFELLKKQIETLRQRVIQVCDTLFCHRSLYGGLCATHGWGCVVTDKPELYAAMAALYAILSLRG